MRDYYEILGVARTVEALETALAAYDGALLLISHDTSFLTAVSVTRTLPL